MFLNICSILYINGFCSGRHSRHNQVSVLICRAFIKSGTLATREPHSLCTGSGKHPDGVTHIPWRRGRCLVWNAQTHSHRVTWWQAATRLALPLQQLKSTKPWSITTSSQVLTLCRWLSKRRASREGKLSNWSTKSVVKSRHWHMNLVRRLSFVNVSRWQLVQRGNAYCVLDTFKSSRTVDCRQWTWTSALLNTNCTLRGCTPPYCSYYCLIVIIDCYIIKIISLINYKYDFN